MYVIIALYGLSLARTTNLKNKNLTSLWLEGFGSLGLNERLRIYGTEEKKKHNFG